MISYIAVMGGSHKDRRGAFGGDTLMIAVSYSSSYGILVLGVGVTKIPSSKDAHQDM